MLLAVHAQRAARAHSKHLERGSFKDVTAAAFDRARAIQPLAALHQITPADRALPTLVREKRPIMIAFSYRLIATGAAIDWPWHD
jgi:hypothetical protein